MMIYLKEASRSLYANKQRTILALIGIIIGIGSVISLVSIGKIVTAEATRQFRELGTDLARLRFRLDSQDGVLKSPSFIQGVVSEPCLRYVAPYLRGQYDTQDNNVELGVFGITQSFATVSKLALQSGRFISDLDGTQSFVVLGANIPAALQWKGELSSFLGREVLINGQAFTVIGVLKPTESMKSINLKLNQTFFIPIKTQLRDRPETKISDGLARMLPDAQTKACAQNIMHYFKLRSPQMEIQVITADQLIERMRKQSDMFNVLLISIGSISLLVGGIGIMNIMLVSVSERKQEIGIRRAMGAKRKDIRYQFLIESLLLSVFGGAFGIGLGILITYIGTLINDWKFFMLIWPMVMGAGVSAVIGVFFGFFPAHQAANLDPITALRGD